MNAFCKFFVRLCKHVHRSTLVCKKMIRNMLPLIAYRSILNVVFVYVYIDAFHNTHLENEGLIARIIKNYIHLYIQDKVYSPNLKHYIVHSDEVGICTKPVYVQ